MEATGERKAMVESVSPDTVIAKAMELAGFDDFGGDGWRDGLAQSLAAFPKLPLLPQVRQASVAKIVHDLAMRLRIVQWLKIHPGIETQAIDGPVFVIGLPRTGTTATVGMMALDERFRFLRAWEGLSPMPPPVAGEEHLDPRVIAARRDGAKSDHAHMHIVDADGPEEDQAMLAGLDMRSYHGTLPMPDDYLEWWMNSDFSSFYAFEERVFKLLQSSRPPHLWLLKSPTHLFRVREIVQQYPNARFIMTHRDPVKVIGSVASLHTLLHEARCVPGSIDRKMVGPRHLALWAEGMRRFLAVRDELGEDRFMDVRNDDVVKRPVETFERIYNHLGMSLGPELRTRLQEYNSRNAPGSSGRHHYTSGEYGLTDASIRDAFKDYGKRFDWS
jgi:hypothetical protein